MAPVPLVSCSGGLSVARLQRAPSPPGSGLAARQVPKEASEPQGRLHRSEGCTGLCSKVEGLGTCIRAVPGDRRLWGDELRDADVADGSVSPVRQTTKRSAAAGSVMHFATSAVPRFADIRRFSSEDRERPVAASEREFASPTRPAATLLGRRGHQRTRHRPAIPSATNSPPPAADEQFHSGLGAKPGDADLVVLPAHGAPPAQAAPCLAAAATPPAVRAGIQSLTPRRSVAQGATARSMPFRRNSARRS